MFKIIKQKWQSLNSSEQKLLFGGFMLIVSVSAYYYAWKPYYQIINNYQQKVEHLQQDLAWLKQVQNQLKYLTSKKNNKVIPLTGSLIDHVDKSIKRFKIRSVEALKKTGNRKVVVVFKSVNFDTLIRWLIQLKKSGIKVKEADIKKTDKNGLVYARLGLSMTNES